MDQKCFCHSQSDVSSTQLVELFSCVHDTSYMLALQSYQQICTNDSISASSRKPANTTGYTSVHKLKSKDYSVLTTENDMFWK